MLNRILDHLEEWLISFLMGAATIVIFVSVLHRYLSGVPVLQDWLLRIDMSWAQEAATYMFVWMAKFGAAYGVRFGTHVGVDVLVRKLPPAKARWLILTGLAGGALFTGIVGSLGADFVWRNGFHYSLFTHLGLDVGDTPEGPTTPDMELPTWIVYACVPLGSWLMCYRFLQVMVHFWKTGEVPHQEHGHVEGIDDDQPHEVHV
ncbi:MAG: TRAP transporter small permease [Burkholderiales bacterium]|nr:TRAP transporter small permease [Burkholderiales bacterium]MDE1927626.1 TRAP transporter small permease [Burkholderiales bacterium]MDE2158717.1 TRAP transporter small permease [Burkholderiales bacterium]